MVPYYDVCTFELLITLTVSLSGTLTVAQDQLPWYVLKGHNSLSHGARRAALNCQSRRIVMFALNN